VKHIKALKHDKHGPNYVGWSMRRNNVAMFYKIKNNGIVNTSDGEMILVNLRSKVNLANPEHDIAVLVGNVVYEKNGRQNPLAPELWYWQDEFWIKAVRGDGLEYYYSKNFAFYKVDVKDPDNLMGKLKTTFG